LHVSVRRTMFSIAGLARINARHLLNAVFTHRPASLDAVDDIRLEQALTNIRDGPEAPEPGGGCDGPNLLLTGGTGNPE
jgi:hypothetical protein